MRNEIAINFDSERKDAVIISKPAGMLPVNSKQARTMIFDDMATLCEAICTLIHVADQNGQQKSADSLRDCIAHLEHGFGDASYMGKLVE